MKFVVVNSNPETISAFKTSFKEVSLVCSNRVSLQCFEGTLGQYVDSIKTIKMDKVAVVSPANSLSFMGGGFDRAIAEIFTGPGQDYRTFEAKVQNYTLSKFHGFIPPQSVTVVDLKEIFADFFLGLKGCSKITHLIQTPTMVVPEKISATTVFYCIWNILLAIDGKLNTIILPAIGAGYGGVPGNIVARIISGAIGLYYMDIDSMTRGTAVLLFLKKDYKAFEDLQDIARIESNFSTELNGINSLLYENEEYPLEWPVLCRYLNLLE